MYLYTYVCFYYSSNSVSNDSDMLTTLNMLSITQCPKTCNVIIMNHVHNNTVLVHK